ncbi:MAG: hypothetical protein WC789_01370 [Lentisphaeria bacterium]|jgi:hypothetical protein
MPNLLLAPLAASFLALLTVAGGCTCPRSQPPSPEGQKLLRGAGEQRLHEELLRPAEPPPRAP